MNRTYRNPVYPHSFPDPFVLKYGTEFWAYCTGFWHDGRCFGVLRSNDLVHWETQPGAMAPLPDNYPEYWAPEVAYWNGTFYLYYSVGNEAHMELRVATSQLPGGPFVDSGHRLTEQEFAIDAHVFTDADGDRYLFYATDFLDHPRVGTGTVADRLLDPFTLAGQPRPVTRALHDWHIYDPNRVEKGGVRWHTIEGPSVLRHKGRYYQMFSAGNWQFPGYGVSYATNDAVLSPREWTQVADGVRVLPILRSEGEVVGPGHNSVVPGPDNRQLFCVYHRWVGDERVMSIDRLEWIGDRLAVLGPTTTLQPAPIQPGVTGFTAGWEQARDSRHLALRYPAFLAEMYVRPAAGPRLSLMDESGALLQLSVDGRELTLTTPDRRSSAASLPSGLATDSFHRLRIAADGNRVSLDLPGTAIRWEAVLDRLPGTLAVSADDPHRTFQGFALTYGWEETFEAPVSDVDLLWESRPAGSFSVRDGQLFWDTEGTSGLMQRGPSLPEYELVVNLRLARAGTGGHYGVHPALVSGETGPLITVEARGGWSLIVRDGSQETSYPLPLEFTPSTFQQFRFWKQGGTLTVRLENLVVAEIGVPVGPSTVGFVARDALVVFDMVRVTVVP